MADEGQVRKVLQLLLESLLEKGYIEKVREEDELVNASFKLTTAGKEVLENLEEIPETRLN